MDAIIVEIPMCERVEIAHCNTPPVLLKQTFSIREREQERDSICQDYIINMWVLVMIEICIGQISGHQSTP